MLALLAGYVALIERAGVPVSASAFPFLTVLARTALLAPPESRAARAHAAAFAASGMADAPFANGRGLVFR
ncbi:hypothetical protein [Poseidonocella sp. HB161398]|uniref:hypothetical protein n=1 Tax=Poseidonocella sp. HB161398 TaxID=2320855 RepID=UPI001108DB4B|nr:hypothetical protein [Poseidonocella sp. HB161398]